MVNVSFPAVLCFSHLRWSEVHERPHQLMKLFARETEVLFFEDSVRDASWSGMDTRSCEIPRISLITPHLATGLLETEIHQMISGLIVEMLEARGIENYVCWYYNPYDFNYTFQLSPRLVVYDCLNNNKPPDASETRENAELQFLDAAQIIFLQSSTQRQPETKTHQNIIVVPDGIEERDSVGDQVKRSNDRIVPVAPRSWVDAYAEIRTTIVRSLDVPTPEPQADYPLGSPSMP